MWAVGQEPGLPREHVDQDLPSSGEVHSSLGLLADEERGGGQREGSTPPGGGLAGGQGPLAMNGQPLCFTGRVSLEDLDTASARGWGDHDPSLSSGGSGFLCSSGCPDASEIV